MKKLIALFAALMLCLSLCACENGEKGGNSKKSDLVKSAEEAIEAIGEVTIDSNDAVKNAEKLYEVLTDAEKEKVSNRLTLVEARESLDAILEEAIYANAKEAYEMLNAVADKCEAGMDDIYGAWYFGIYGSSTISSSVAFDRLAAQTPNLSSSSLESAAKSLGISKYNVVGNWQNCVYIAETAHSRNGDYDFVTEQLSEVENTLRELTGEYEDYTYYPKLKEYFSVVSSYADFFLSPTGSFSQLSDTINGYETDIRTYRSEVGFLF